MKKPGTIVGKHYRCRNLLAEGGMAEVYLAERLSSDPVELVALKHLLPRLAQKPMFADMFAYEASLSSSFSHKNIVRCVEFFREGDDFYMALEYVLGKEVGALMQQTKTWSCTERIKFAVAIGLGVIEALCYVHSRCDQFGNPAPVIHGDISPQNIMIDVTGEVKLYDFGAAQTGMSTPSFSEDVVRGHPRYMAPEQMAGLTVEPASDIFSLSLILFEIILGDVRLDRSDRVFLAKLSSAVDGLGLTPNLQASIKHLARGLAHDVEERLHSCAQMRACLKTLARELSLFSCKHYLEQIIRADGPTIAKRPARQRARMAFSSFFYVLVTAIVLGMSVWSMIAMFSDVFEPKHQHSVPAWSQPLEPPPPPVISTPTNVPIISPPKKQRTAGKAGVLLVKVKPWAEVFIDGQFYGSTPMGGVQLPEGQYLVQLRNPDVSAVALRMVKIYADKKTELVHNF